METHRTPQEIAECALIVNSLVSRPGERVDAIIVLPGLGQNGRLAEAAELTRHFHAAHFIHTGQNSTETELFGPRNEQELRKIVGNHLPASVNVIMQVEAAHTQAQVAFAVPRIRDLGIRTCLLAAPGWHLTRGYLTFVREVLNQGVLVQAFTFPVARQDPLRPATPDHRMSGYESYEEAARAEVARCIRYAQHVAGLDDLITYLTRVGMNPYHVP